MAGAMVMLAVATGPVQASCLEQVGFPIFQGANLGYFAPPPVPVLLDPNSRPLNVTTVFWQIGFGNQLVNNGLGSAGTAISPAGVFSGNDQGLFAPDLQNLTFYIPGFPPGSLTLTQNNWGNGGVDGCSDNPRDVSLPVADDGVLNPYYDVYQSRYAVYPGVYSLLWQQDYPMAVLLKDSTGGFFAVAAVATHSRGNTGDGQNGPCNPINPGSNPAPCSTAPISSYDFADVANGLPNPLAPGKNNVVPWQATPQPQVTSAAPLDPNDPNSSLTVDVQWPAVTIHSDLSIRPSTNPSLAPANPAAAPGVGVSDIASKFPLVRYVLETAAPTDPGFTNPTGRIETLSTSISGLTMPVNSCLHVRTLFGKKPQTTAATVADCRVGRCGDVGYEVVSGAICTGSCTPEVCDGLDNDCDGAIDNGNPGGGQSCTTGVPGPCGPGTTACLGGQTVCVPTSSPAPEVCDGVDNDCDGSVDDGNPGGGASCNTGQPGACGTGILLCGGGHIVCSQVTFPSAEVCDGLDNDCDGVTDEGPVIISSIIPSTINVRSQGNTFTLDLSRPTLCSPDLVSIDPSTLGVVHVSVAGNATLPDPFTIACPGPGGDTGFERGIFDDIAGRSVRNGATRLKFDLPPDGDCATLDGDRQDLIALLSDWLDGTLAPMCVAGLVGGEAFEACTAIAVQNRGNR